MPTTTQLILAQTITSPTNTVTFSSIPQTFKDLKILYTGRATISGCNWANVTFNNGSYSSRFIINSGASIGADTNNYATLANDSFTSNTFASGEIYIPNYTSSNQKPFLVDGVAENNATGSFSGWGVLTSALATQTDPITSITLTTSGSPSPQFAVGSSFYLYGIDSNTTTQNTSGPYALGGNTITTDGTYWYHTFLNSNSFTPLKNLSNVDFLVVAGGGGAGGDLGGAGGAGGLRCTVTATGGGGSLESKLSLTAGTVYAAVVGAGGAGNTGDTNGTNGSDSIFSTITSTGGGGGCGDTVSAGSSGGSGGGSASAIGKTGGAGTTNQGYAGGNSLASGSYTQASNGGGGAGAVGGTQSSGAIAGNGGNGVATSISGSSVTYAGGGGGGTNASGTAGTGGTGGGGNGGKGSNVAGSSGTANTGGGGGGGSYQGGDGGSGGSGIIIVRYAV